MILVFIGFILILIGFILFIMSLFYYLKYLYLKHFKADKEYLQFLEWFNKEYKSILK